MLAAPQQTAIRSKDALSLVVHATPSALVMITPLAPTATNSEPVKAMPLSFQDGPGEQKVQRMPSRLVRMVPPDPTAMNRPLPYAIPFRSKAVPEVLSVHAEPSGLVNN
jgi:hypothetical protein